MRTSFIAGLVLTAISAVVASPVEAEAGAVCSGQVTVSESFIGEDRNVKVEVATCPKAIVQPRALLEGRQTNLCTVNCTRNCFLPSGGGPDPNDCHIIADALRFESQNTGAIFEVGTGVNNTVLLTYSSCKSFFVNQDLAPVAYCRTNWANTLDNVAVNCQATQNAHGGNCVATDQRYFIQVQHS
ncbi:hypothetical protein FPV67DRAFT_1670500 [Lyophyllum atratum]|nr:hypothetical protein FPV67DRAFT_1670500 [Lyophyllum atratum]